MEVSKRIFNLETETAFSILAKANDLAAKGKDIINLGIGQPDFPTPINIQEAAIKAIKDGYHGYTPSNGIPELREAVSELVLNKYKTNIKPENVLITPGGKPVIFISALLLGNEDRGYLLDLPVSKDNIKSKINEIVIDKNNATIKGKEGKDFVSEKYNLANTFSLYKNLFVKLLEEEYK